MAAALKSILGSLGEKKHPTLEDFPEYVAERDRLRDIANQFNHATAKLQAAKNSALQASKVRESAIAKVAALVTGAVAPPSDVRKPDIEQIEFDVGVFREAVTIQQEVVNRVTDECVQRIWSTIRPEHVALLADVLDKTVALADALDSESDFLLRCQREGLSLGGCLTLSATIKRAIGSRRVWSSGVNATGRAISEYVGRGAWDHSRVAQ